MTPAHPWLDVTVSGTITKARLTTRTLVDDRIVGAVGDELYRLGATPGARLLIDFSGVTRVASSMLAKVVELDRRLKAAGGRLVLCGLDPDVYDLFEVTRLNRIISIFPSETEALRQLGALP